MPDGYEIVDADRRTVSLAVGDDGDLASLVVRRDTPGELDQIRRDLLDHLEREHGYGADGAGLIDGERYSYRARGDTYDG